MAQMRLFASAREAAGTKSDTLAGSTVGEVLDAAVAKYGDDFAGVLETAAVWCNGDAVERDHPVSDADEVAVLPPVSGGSDAVSCPPDPVRSASPGRLPSHRIPSRANRQKVESQR